MHYERGLVEEAKVNEDAILRDRTRDWNWHQALKRYSFRAGQN
jgi:hypothetical protein